MIRRWAQGWYTPKTEMTNSGSKSIVNYLRQWGWLSLGLLLFVTSLPLYESLNNPVIMGRWSGIYAIVMAVAITIWIAVSWLTWRIARSSSPSSVPPVWQTCLGFAIFAWGLAYAVTSWIDPTNAGRITNLDFFGSTNPVSAILEWISISSITIAFAAALGPKLPKRFQDAGLMLMTIAALAVLGEGIARVKVIAFPQVQGFPTHSTRIWRQRNVTTNSLGYRDTEHEVTAKVGVKRALIVGDSFTFGTGIDRIEERFSEQLAGALDVQTSTAWEVINAGWPDTHTLEHIAALRNFLIFEPDLVVLLYVFNDIDYLAPVTQRGWTSGGRLHPIRILFANSFLFQELYVRARRLFFGEEQSVAADPYASGSVMRQHLEDIGEFASIVQASGATVRVLPFDNFVELNEQRKSRYRSFVAALTGGGIPVCSLEHAFEGHAPADLQVNSLDGHANALAYSLAVEESFDCLVLREEAESR